MPRRKKKVEESEGLAIKNLPKKRPLKGSQATVPTVVKDDRNYSRFNALKHGRYADLPMYCNDCVYRSEDAGGNGKCRKYKEDSVCILREDIKVHCREADSRKPEDLKTIVDEAIELIRERALFGILKAGMDGNNIDKQTNAQFNLLHTYLKLADGLQGNVKVTETLEVSEDADFVMRMMRQVKEKNGEK